MCHGTQRGSIDCSAGGPWASDRLPGLHSRSRWPYARSVFWPGDRTNRRSSPLTRAYSSAAAHVASGETAARPDAMRAPSNATCHLSPEGAWDGARRLDSAGTSLPQPAARAGRVGGSTPRVSRRSPYEVRRCGLRVPAGARKHCKGEVAGYEEQAGGRVYQGGTGVSRSSSCTRLGGLPVQDRTLDRRAVPSPPLTTHWSRRQQPSLVPRSGCWRGSPRTLGLRTRRPEKRPSEV